MFDESVFPSFIAVNQSFNWPPYSFCQYIHLFWFTDETAAALRECRVYPEVLVPNVWFQLHVYTLMSRVYVCVSNFLCCGEVLKALGFSGLTEN